MPCWCIIRKIEEQEGYPLTFMSGFAASATKLGAPDLGLMSYGEVVDHAGTRVRIRFPLIADGDTGYGNAMNVQRTVFGLAQAGAAAVIEDQVAPSDAVTPGKAVVSEMKRLTDSSPSARNGCGHRWPRNPHPGENVRGMSMVWLRRLSDLPGFPN